jgi:hypothetical protein
MLPLEENLRRKVEIENTTETEKETEKETGKETGKETEIRTEPETGTENLHEVRRQNLHQPAYDMIVDNLPRGPK